ncbi:MAG: hypothetical protein BM562_03720 [Alphaproteobacteria bacterium MedPE-SWcel]|nr:MAG: hypothetical protein BM562_03720 [Alphaproteobacteria bacterium MedPE-SWcel]
MAILGMLIGLIAGLALASIGFFTFDLSLWICIVIYAIGGSLSATCAFLTVYFLQSDKPEPSDTAERAEPDWVRTT